VAPDDDLDPDLVDADQSTLLGVVSPPEPESAPLYDEAIRTALAATDDALRRFREQRREDDRTGLAEIAQMKRDLIAKRKATNEQIKELDTERRRLLALVRVLDKQ
jgi:hypothetical protein